MIRGHSEPDQAKGDRQTLINVHLNILASLRKKQKQNPKYNIQSFNWIVNKGFRINKNNIVWLQN